MARTAEAVRSLVDEDPEMETAIESVLERDGEGDLQWSDVNDDLTSGQWGRLIETGVLEDGGGDGFRVADPESIEAALYGDAEVDPDAPEGDSSWSTMDKVAGLLALSLFPGYYFESVRATVGSLLDVLFGPLASALPFYAVILVLAVLTGLYSTLLQANLMDMDKMSYYQEQMKDLQERRKAAKERGDDEALERIQEEQMERMGEQMGMFKEQFRPMVWIMLLTIPVFLWMYWMILDGHIANGATVVLPLVGEVTWTAGVLGPLQAWIVWYFLCSMSLSQIIRKSLNVQTTPT